MIGLVVTMKIKEGQEETFEQAFLKLAGEVRANEPGCLLYSLMKKEPGVYVVMEQYASQDALDAHGKTAHFAAAGPAFGACLAGRPEIVRLTGVG